MFSNSYSQVYVIDSTFTQDAVLHPFGSSDTLYSLKISGSLTLNSDTSLVRVVVGNEDSLEYMVYEAYPLICLDDSISFVGKSDETSYLNVFLPTYIKIHIKNARVSIGNIFDNSYYKEGLDSLQFISKIHHDSLKTEFINANIQENGWMTGIVSQGSCGSCSAFGSIAAFEAQVNIYFNFHADIINDLRLSERDAFNCSRFQGIQVGCSCDKGKQIPTILYYLKSQGVVDENCYPKPTDPNELYCQGSPPEPDCSFSTKCTDPDYIVNMETFSTIYLADATNLSISRDEYLKRKIIEHGLLIIMVGNLFGERHAVALVGFERTESGNTLWIMKNSWGYQFGIIPPSGWEVYGDKGYVISRLLLEKHNVNPYMVDTLYAIGKPQMIKTPEELTEPFEIHTYDKEKDGYWNWGFDEPNGWDPPCNSTKEDWNDNDNRIGNADENFYPIEVQPEMEVYIGHPDLGGIRINNKDYFYFDNSTIPSGGIFKVYIKNSGTAQLNLEQLNTVLGSPNNSNCFLLNYSGLNPAICNCTTNLTYFEVTFDLNCLNTQGIHEIASYTIDVYQKDEDVLEDFEFGLAYFDCQKTTGTYYPSNGEIWDEYEVIIQDVHIPQQYTLTVTGNVAIAKGVNIIVDESAELIIDGGILQGSCGYFWNGIDVWGNDEYSQFGTKQGKVRVINGGAIKHAICGIEQGIHAVPETFIDLTYVEGILFKGNTFKNNATTQNESRGIGIRAGTAGFYIYNECAMPNTIPCPEYYLSKFEHLDYGIMVLGDRESLPIVIDSATFTDNLRGILMSGVNNAEVFHNTFEMDIPDSYHSTTDTLVGVYLEACQEFMLTENYFNGYSGTQMKHAAIYAHNLGSYYNEIYNNTIENLSCGIIAAGENRSSDGTEGLCIKCNDFENCLNDIYVIPYGGITSTQYGIATNQGDINLSGNSDNSIAAGNTFSITNGTEPNYINHKCNHIDYFFHGQNQTYERLDPNPYEGDITTEGDDEATYTKDGSCPSQLFESINLASENATILIEAINISDYEDTLSMYIDGGDTEDLNLEVYTSMPQEALQIRQELLNESPYLSDTVMNTAISKENVLPNVMVRDVLVSNPQSAKSVSVMQTLDQRFDPMPDYMMAEIMQGQDIKGAKEIIEQKLARHKKNKFASFYKLFRHYKKDTVLVSQSFDSLVSLLQNEQNPDSRYRLSMLYLDSKDSSNVFSVLNNIPIEFYLNQKEQHVFDLYSDLFDILWNMKTDINAPDSLQKQTLIDIAENQRCLPGLYARNLLISMGLYNYNEPIYLPDNFKTEEYIKPYYKHNRTDEILKILPNPAGDYFIVYYNLPNGIFQPKLVVTGINGEAVKSVELNESVNQLVIPMSNNPAGVYMVYIYLDNDIIASSKVIVSR